MTEFRKVESLEFPQSLRSRYALYAGDNSTSTILFREPLDNTIDVYLASKKDITVRGYCDGICHIVADTGIGLPLYKDNRHKDDPDRSIIKDVLTSLHTGSNFSRNKRLYPSLGLNGVGIKITVACSKSFYAIVNIKKSYPDDPHRAKFAKENELYSLPEYICNQYNTGDWFVIHFEEGIYKYDKVSNTEELKTLILNDEAFSEDEKLSKRLDKVLDPNYGTVLLFRPSTQIIRSEKVEYEPFSAQLIAKYFPQDSDYKDSKYKILFNGKKPDPFSFKTYFEEEPFFNDKVFDFSFNYETSEAFPIKFLGSFAYHNEDMEESYGGAINLLSTDEGKHIQIFKKALGKALHYFDSRLSASDCRYGLRLFVLSIGLAPEFDSQLKIRFLRFEDEGFDEADCVEQLSNYLYDEVLNSNQAYFKGLCEKIIEYKLSLEDLSQKEYILDNITYSDESNPLKSIGFGSKIWDCTSKSLKNRMLYIVEGDSAAGNLIKKRNPKTTAILPLRGVVLNTLNVNLERIVENNEMQTLITALGTGLEPYIDMKLRRYERVLIACDADPSGAFISALLLGFFGAYLRPWIEGGHVYKLISPLYKQDGKYIYKSSNLDRSRPFSRFKGLGELSPGETREVLLDNPRLLKITSEETEKAIEIIMNDKNIRRELSIELGLLVDKEEFISEVNETSKSIIAGLDESISMIEDSLDE